MRGCLLLAAVLVAACSTPRTGAVPDAAGLDDPARDAWLEAREAAWDGRRDQAIDALARLTAANPDHVPSRLWLVDLHVDREGAEAVRERLRAAATDGDWIDALLFARLERDPTERLDAYEGLLADHPNEVWLMIAVVDAALDRFAEADGESQSLRASGTMEGEDRAKALEREAGRALRRAEAAMADAVRARPELIAARWREADVLGVLAERETDRERVLELRRRVVEAWEAALAVDPNDVTSLVGRAEAARRSNDYPAARGALERAAKVRPGAPEIRQNLGVVAYEMGDYVVAERELRAAVELRPRDADLRRNLGDALVAVDRLRDARAEYREALRIRPDDTGLIERLGNLALRLDNLQDAMVHYGRYLELGGPNPERVRAAIRRLERERRDAGSGR